MSSLPQRSRHSKDMYPCSGVWRNALFNSGRSLGRSRWAIQAFGGRDGVRDMDLLESAVATPQMTFDGVELNATVFDKAPRWLSHLRAAHRGQVFTFDNYRSRREILTLLPQLAGQCFIEQQLVR